MGQLWEISDLIVDYDPETLQRRPVRRSEVVEKLRDNDQRWAARVAGRIRADGDVLDPVAVDRLLFRAHAEIQQLSEDFCQADRVWTLLEPLLEVLRAGGVDPVRVVDVGCGLGYLMRWLAREYDTPHIEWLGVDLNAALVRAARRLAAGENLNCEFRHANAFRLDQRADVFLSNGVLHHMRGEALDRFFAEQRELSPYAFIHFDIQPSWASPIGAFLFHRARCQEAICRHDGYCSALRAHSGEVLEAAASAPGDPFRVRLFDNMEGWSPIFRAMHAVVGIREDVDEPWRDALGAVARRLGEGA